jgi:hypothetical protein
MGTSLRSRLHGVAVGALNNFYSMAIHDMSFLRIFFILVMQFVVTETTGYKGVATGS